MLFGMICRNSTAFAAIYVIWLAGSVTAGSAAENPLANQSTPELKIRVYGFPGLSGGIPPEAYTEAERLLRPAAIRLKWVDCTSPVLSVECTSLPLPTDLTVRVVATALPPATPWALGLAAWSGDLAAAFIFYDRVVALRTNSRFVPSILGRVMAHEITHLLLGSQSHSEIGLMKGQWSADDLRTVNSAWLGLPIRSVEFMQKEARRRVLIAQNLTVK
jgi:hypothetical protein